MRGCLFKDIGIWLMNVLLKVQPFDKQPFCFLKGEPGHQGVAGFPGAKGDKGDKVR